jgi:hypothetical protein
MSGTFNEVFHWVATIVMGILILSFPLLLWKAERDVEREKDRKNKKAS